MKSAQIIGMMAEVLIKAKILKNRLKKNPSLLTEILNKIDILEQEMIFYYKKL